MSLRQVLVLMAFWLVSRNSDPLTVIVVIFYGGAVASSVMHFFTSKTVKILFKRDS